MQYVAHDIIEVADNYSELFALAVVVLSPEPMLTLNLNILSSATGIS